MKSFHKNSCRIENEVFILYMLDYELVIAFNLKKKKLEIIIYKFGYGVSWKSIDNYNVFLCSIIMFYD
jgi:hypothetical protein